MKSLYLYSTVVILMTHFYKLILTYTMYFNHCICTEFKSNTDFMFVYLYGTICTHVGNLDLKFPTLS